MQRRLKMGLNRLARQNACFFILFFVLPVAQADGFTVSSAKLYVVENTYRLSAQLGYKLSDDVNEAIHNGIPITLKLELEILRKRDYLWAATIIVVEQRYRIQFHALSEQYLVNNLKTGEQTFYKVLSDALYNLENGVDFPVINTRMLDPNGQYFARLRSSLDITELPVPLRFFAYFSYGWTLNSHWYSWSIFDKDEV